MWLVSQPSIHLSTPMERFELVYAPPAKAYVFMCISLLFPPPVTKGVQLSLSQRLRRS